MSDTGIDNGNDNEGSNGAAGTAIAAVLGTLGGLIVIFYLYRRFCRHGFSASGLINNRNGYKSAEMIPQHSTHLDIEDEEDYESDEASEDGDDESDDEDRIRRT
jgi:hypothetical protein